MGAEIGPGKVVKLNVDGPEMAVTRVKDEPGGRIAECCWFDLPSTYLLMMRGNYALKTGEFAVESLVVVDREADARRLKEAMEEHLRTHPMGTFGVSKPCEIRPMTEEEVRRTSALRAIHETVARGVIRRMEEKLVGGPLAALWGDPARPGGDSTVRADVIARPGGEMIIDQVVPGPTVPADPFDPERWKEPTDEAAPASSSRGYEFL